MLNVLDVTVQEIKACEGQMLQLWKILGYVIMVIKIVIPLLIIVFGMIDLGKAVISSDEKQIGKSVQSLIKRIVAGIVIFFVPAIVNMIFNAVDSNDQRTACYNCIFSLENC